MTRNAHMRGSLTWMPVCDLLRFGLREDCSGTLDLWRSSADRGLVECGRIVFTNGWVLEACSPAVGDGRDRAEVAAAVCELLRWREGSFEIALTCRSPVLEMTLELDLSRLVRDAISRSEAISVSRSPTFR